MQFLAGKVGPTVWNMWESLFNEKEGTHALIIAGFFTPRKFVTDELLVPIANWMQKGSQRELSVFIGLTPIDGDERTKIVDSLIEVLANLLGRLEESERSRVHIHLVPYLHAKAYAIYEGNPRDFCSRESSCLKLLMGSSNLSLTAFANNFEFDAYLTRPEDAEALDNAASMLQRLIETIYFGRTENDQPSIDCLDVYECEIGSIWGVNMDFYDALRLRMNEVSNKLSSSEYREIERFERQQSEACLKADE